MAARGPGSLRGARRTRRHRPRPANAPPSRWNSATAAASERDRSLRPHPPGDHRPRSRGARPPLVTEGYANPAIAQKLYLSVRTVESHISSLLAKLGAASRVEFAQSRSRAPTIPH
ncbi:MAG: response regulator transcription factor [Acidimicrobiales bacterium]